MKRRHYLSLVGVALLLAGCERGSPVFHIQPSTIKERAGLGVLGYGWKPNANVEIWAYGEPIVDGGQIYSGPPRKLTTIKASSYGDLNNPPHAYIIPITQFCGSAPPYVKPWYMAVDKDNNVTRLPQFNPFNPGAHYFKAC